MPGTTPLVSYTCSRCLRRLRPEDASPTSLAPARRLMSYSRHLQTPQAPEANIEGDNNPPARDVSTDGTTQTTPPQELKKEQGAMSRRLAEATEDALLDGGCAGQRAVEEAGFSDELKARLLDKIAGQKFKAENLAAFTEAEMPSVAGRGTRDIAIAQPWTGTEEQGDAVLRMLHDAHKPLKPELRGQSANVVPVVDMRLQGTLKQTPGQRISKARDRTNTYATANDNNSSMTPKEREETRATLKERFGSGVQTGVMPTSFRGLQSLANQRIEDAIARRQFKDIPRGTSVLRDRRADNPFIDTTEYIMNNMIKRQALVPPWIEKQQSLRTAAANFRARLRKEWTRHAVGMVSAQGGTVQEQVRRAEAYARAERAGNRQQHGAEEISVPSHVTSHPVMASVTKAPSSPIEMPLPEPPEPAEPLPAPLRDTAWEREQLPYWTLAIAELNAAARAYNLQAPELAKKPYFSLEREMGACFADVAPLLAGEIKGGGAGVRQGIGDGVKKDKSAGEGGVMWRVVGERTVIRDERAPRYGFRELWRDVFKG